MSAEIGAVRGSLTGLGLTAAVRHKARVRPHGRDAREKIIFAGADVFCGAPALHRLPKGRRGRLFRGACLPPAPYYIGFFSMPAVFGQQKSPFKTGFLSTHLCAFDLTGTQTTGAGIDMFRCAIYHCFNSLYIRLKGTVGTAVGMGDLDPERYAFSADIAFCHYSAPPCFKQLRLI